MKHLTTTCLLCVVFCLILNTNASSQIILCDGDTLQIDSFLVDSSVTYNNRYVHYQAVEPINKSKYPVEIRVYTIGQSIDNVKIDIIQSDGKKSKLITKEVLLGNVRARNKTADALYQNGRIVGTMSVRENEVSIPCEQFANLRACGLFRLASSEQFQLKRRTDGKVFHETTVTYIFEIKVNDYLRNFTYTSDMNYVDTVAGRAQSVSKIIEILTHLD
jgi:hypothetical protein